MLVNGKCSECVEEGKQYNVYPGGKSTTLLGWTPEYWDKDGNHIINKDPNTTTQEFRCSNGHYWIKKTKAGEVIFEGHPGKELFR